MRGAQSVADFGVALAVVSPVFMFCQFRVADAYASGACGVLDARMASILVLLFSGLAFGGVQLFYGVWVPNPVYGLIASMLLWKVIENLAEPAFGVMQERKQIKKMAVLLAAKGLTIGFTASSALYLSGSVVVGVSAIALTYAIYYLLFELRIVLSAVAKEKSTSNWSVYKNFKECLQFLLPLGFVSLLTTATTQLPVLIGGKIVDPSSVGAYVALVQLLVAVALVNKAISKVSVKELAVSVNDSKASFLKVFRQVMVLSIFLASAFALAFIVLGNWFMGFVYGPEFMVPYGVLVLVMVGKAFEMLGGHVGNTQIVFKQTTSQAVINLVALGVGVAVGVVLTPAYGIYGMAAVYMSASASRFLMGSLLVYRGVANRWPHG